MPRRKRAAPASASICLCMMVKNEAPIIRWAISSALPYISSWSILDTGSTDGTQAIVHELLDGLPGALVEEPWIDFATGRTTAAELARWFGTDYLLVMDADQTLVVDQPNAFAGLQLDAYNITIQHGDVSYPHPWLLSCRLAWQWDGATHEALVLPAGLRFGDLSGAHLIEHADSHRRSTGAKLREDRELLERAYADDPTDGRTVFYLAQLCQDEGRIPCAIKHYRERIALGGWPEETWCAQYRIGRLRDASGAWPLALEAYLEAWRMDPCRAEPMYRLGRGCLMRKQFGAALVFFRAAASLGKPASKLFVEDKVYDYAAWWGVAMAQRLVGEHEHAEELEDTLMQSVSCPESVAAEIRTQRESKSIGRLPG